MTDLDDMSLEDLKKELEGLKKENMKAELEAEKAKVEERKKEKAKEDEEKLRNEIRQDLLKEMQGKSKVGNEKEKTTNDSGNSQWMNFKERFAKSSGVKTDSYEELCKKTYQEQMGL